MKRLFYSLLFLLPAFIANAQTFTVSQCSGTPTGGLGSNLYGPMYTVSTANAASRTAIIYPASQLTSIAGSALTSIYFYRLTASGAMAGTPNYKIYLKEVTSADWGAAFTSWSDTIATATLVYDGNPATIVGSTAGWKAFPFSSNFTYSGSSNLAVLTEYTNTTASTAITWTYEYTSPCVNTANSNTTKYFNNTTGTLTNTLGSTNYRRPYTGFDILLSCYPPTAITVSGITTTTAQVAWTAPTAAPSGGYEYYYTTSSTAPTTSTTPSGTTASNITSAQLSGLSSGTTYYVWVRSACSASDKSPWANGGSFATLFATPANDEASGAIGLTVNPDYNCGSTTNGTTQGATQSADAAPSCNATGINDDVWYTFTASNASHRFVYSNVVSGTIATALYTGTPGNLTAVANACLSGTTQAFTGLTAGTVYYARVYTTVATATTLTTFTVCVGTPPPPPANDDVCGAVALTVSPGNTCTSALINQSTAGATQSLAGCVGTADEDVWYSFVATNTTHYITLTVSGNGVTDRVHQVFSSSDNTCSGTLTSVVCSDPESSTLTGLTVGNTYFVRVYSYTATTTSYTTFDICVTSPLPPPANDLPTGAIALTVDANCTAAPYTNAGATLATNEPRISCKGSQTAANSVWFKFVAPTGGVVRVTTDVTGNGLTDTRLGLFSASNPSDLSTYQIIACDDDNGSTVANASTLYATGLTPGATYYVAVDHWNGAGTGTFCVQVHSTTTAMLAATGSCTTGQDLSSYLADYKGWLSLTNTTGQLIANVRANTTLSTTPTYTIALNVNTGSVRQDGNSKYYLDRNYRITNTLTGNYDVQFFFLAAELSALRTVSATTALANLNATRVKGESACNANFVSGGAANDSLLVQTASGSANNVNWITVNTPGFSNFYLHSGTTPLPIKFEYLTGKKVGSTNALNWKVTCTSTSITMVLERSADARTFNQIITSITATQARCGQPFDAVDATPINGISYYRLKMIDVDGKVSYSPVAAVLNGKAGAELVGIYPTVVQDQAYLSVTSSRNTTMQFSISDMSGKVIKTINQAVSSGSSMLPVNTSSLASGVYNITGLLDGIRTQTLRFVKQ